MANEKYLDYAGLSRLVTDIKDYVGTNASIIITTSNIAALSAETLESLKVGQVVVYNSSLGYKEAYIVVETRTNQVFLANFGNAAITTYSYIKSNNVWTSSRSVTDLLGFVNETSSYEDSQEQETKTGTLDNSNGVAKIQSGLTDTSSVEPVGIGQAKVEVDGDTVTIEATNEDDKTITMTITPNGITFSDGTDTIDLFTDFVTRAVDDLTNYYTKSETYTQTEVNTLLGQIPTIKYEVKATLPTADSTTYFNNSKTVYLIAISGVNSGNDYYDEYICILKSGNYQWEKIGNTQVDLSNYYTKTQVDTLLGGKQDTMTAITTQEVDALFN